MEINKSPKVSKKCSCTLCDYNTSKHLTTSKRKNANGNHLETQEISKISLKFKCNKLYNTNSGLWKYNIISKGA